LGWVLIEGKSKDVSLFLESKGILSNISDISNIQSTSRDDPIAVIEKIGLMPILLQQVRMLSTPLIVNPKIDSSTS
jgi:hypothetical protein